MWKYDEQIKVIDGFRGEYAFLSNFSAHTVAIQMPLFDNQYITFRTAEHAFQSFKCSTREEVAWVMAALTPGDAKHRGGKKGVSGIIITPPINWDKTSYHIMTQIVYTKVLQNFDVRRVLINTGNDILIEGNTWGDKIWGMVKNEQGVWEGENRLGMILMHVRWRISWEEYIKKIPYLKR